MPSIEITLIDPPTVYMRRVDTLSIEFQQLRDSIKHSKQLNSILVRPRNDRYQLVDGAYRLEAHKQLGLLTIEAIVQDMPDVEVLLAQVQANAVRPTTSKTDFARHLHRILAAEPMPMAKLAKRLCKDPHWVRDQLNLLDLRLEYQTMVDRGQIPLRNAYSLSRLPSHLQGKYLSDSKNMGAKEFRQLVSPEIQRLQMDAKERTEARRLEAASTEPKPCLRQLKELIREVKTGDAGRSLVTHATPGDFHAAFKLGVKWALNIDPITFKSRQEEASRNEISRILSTNAEIE